MQKVIFQSEISLSICLQGYKLQKASREIFCPRQTLARLFNLSVCESVPGVYKLTIVIPDFRSSLSPLSFSLRLLLFTNFRETLKAEIVSPHILAFLFFCKKKQVFGHVFFFLRPAFSHGSLNLLSGVEQSII